MEMRGTFVKGLSVAASAALRTFFYQAAGRAGFGDACIERDLARERASSTPHDFTAQGTCAEYLGTGWLGCSNARHEAQREGWAETLIIM